MRFPLHVLLLLACLIGIGWPALAAQFPVPGSTASEGTVNMCQSVNGQSAVPCGNSTTPLVTAPPTAAYAAATTVTANTTSGILIPAGTYKYSILLCTQPTSTTNVWLNPAGGVAVAGTGIPIYAGGGCTSFGTPAQPIPSANITGIADGVAAQPLALAGS